MEPLLYLCHRIPYPPDKGDKIRSWHVLRWLAERYRVCLGAFVDDPSDFAHEPVLRELCADVCLRPLRPLPARLRSLGALVGSGPMSLRYYADGALRRWVREVAARESVAAAIAFSSPMAQYLEGLPSLRVRIADVVDVDSEKWAAYARERRGPSAWIYRREARTLLRWEARVARSFDASLFVSEAEADLFRRLVPVPGGRVRAIANGVDCEYFRPDASLPDPYPAGVLPLVFTGAMDYWPNEDAVTWFSREVLPRIRAREPRAAFWIVGARPGPGVRRLQGIEGVTVTGAVADVRPWLQWAALAVAPLRIARGVQNKVLEAMAMARPVLATGAAVTGLESARDCLAVADEPGALAARALVLLGAPDEAAALGCRARARVETEYGWEARLSPLQPLLQSSPAAAAVRAGGGAAA